jgi:hypothetical protein
MFKIAVEPIQKRKVRDSLSLDRRDDCRCIWQLRKLRYRLIDNASQFLVSQNISQNDTL